MTPDTLILSWLHVDMASTMTDTLFNWFSSRYFFSIPILLSLLAYSVVKQGSHGLFWWLSLIAVVTFGDLLGNLLKDLFSEMRPCAISETFLSLRDQVECSDSAKGMPSNHAINFFTATLFVVLTRPNWRGWHYLLFISAVLASVSRIYLAKHFPSQVLTGTVIGIYLGTIAALVYRHRYWLSSLIGNIQPILRKEP
jgi:undecaprenyl-diphosphatase